MAHSLDVYELASAVVRGLTVTSAQRRRAFAAPLETWIRVLSLEGCTVQFERRLQRAGLMAEAPPPLSRFLRDATGQSLGRSVIAHAQLAAIAALAERFGIRVLALKGAARLLSGALGADRAIADIDLLALPADASRLHALLQSEAGYMPSGPAQSHHLAPLARPGALPVEIHLRVTGKPLPLDHAMFTATRRVIVDGSMLELPSPTNMLLHALEHATTLNWMSRYRLRDVLDVAACATPEVDGSAVESYVRRSAQRAALETLLSAAHDIARSIPCARPNAWRTIRRVSRTRLRFTAAVRTGPRADRLFRYLGVLAEGSPAALGRAALTGVRWLGRAMPSVLPARMVSDERP